MPPPPRVRWLDRVVGVAVGAVVTAWLLRSDPSPSRPDESIPAAPGPLGPPESEIGSPVPDASVLAVAPSGEVAPIAPIAQREAEPVVAPLEPAVSPRRVEPLPPTDAAAPPLLPLPRMPGDTRLSSSARFDDAAGSWILKSAFRVHAREHHVIAFYRKALADEGLDVTLVEDPPGADGTVKTYLHGKNGRTHAQVGILPRTDALETRVWILWRARA